MYSLTPLQPLQPLDFFDPVALCSYLRVDAGAYSEEVAPLLLAAMAVAEDQTGAALFGREWELLTDYPYSGYLPAHNARGPLVLKAGTTDVTDRVTLVRDCLFLDELPRASYYTLTFTRGFAPADLPASITQAVWVMVSEWYDNRADGPRALPTLSEKLLNPHRIPK